MTASINNCSSVEHVLSIYWIHCNTLPVEYDLSSISYDVVQKEIVVVRNLASSIRPSVMWLETLQDKVDEMSYLHVQWEMLL